MKLKLQDRLLSALLKLGENKVKELTGCIVVSRKDGGFYYVGRNGSLRHGLTRSGSVTCLNSFYNKLLESEPKNKS